MPFILCRLTHSDSILQLCRARRYCTRSDPTPSQSCLPRMATETVNALFSFRICNDGDSTVIEHTHPVPTFLCDPQPSQRTSKQYYDAFVDVLSVVNAEHHSECMNKVTTPCINCGKPAKDALKSPMSYLHLAQPMVTVQITQICGDKNCEIQTRSKLHQLQKNIKQGGLEPSQSVLGEMNCSVCQKPKAKRCAGCGKAAYCNIECQKTAWKGHKKHCHRRNIHDAEDPVDLPYDAV